MELNDRINAVRKRMSSDDVELLVVASNGFQTIDKPDPIAHLADYRCLAEGLFSLLSTELRY